LRLALYLRADRWVIGCYSFMPLALR
jgi:hypothetical protein